MMMNDMEMIRYKEAFILMDETKCGMITARDVHFLIRALGFTPTEAELERIDAEWIDQRQVDYLWFVEMMSKISCTKYSSEQIEQAFVAFDRHRYGLINLEVFKTTMMTMGEPLSELEMNEMLKDLSVDEDGLIEYESFCTQFKPKDPSIPIRHPTSESRK